MFPAQPTSCNRHPLNFNPLWTRPLQRFHQMSSSSTNQTKKHSRKNKVAPMATPTSGRRAQMAAILDQGIYNSSAEVSSTEVSEDYEEQDQIAAA